jgi:UDP-N-acetylmuramate: L-alanyl-gamma-D-glutamyl-meso-diaminopimelate ligase
MNIHFIAIGGSVMHNLAIALRKKGMNVSGSDDEIFEPARSRLQKAGILPAQEGWQADRITEDLDAVILGMHAHSDNPELARAQELNIPIRSFPEFIFEQAADKRRVVIGGSHGKTTITAMVMHILNTLKVEHDYMVGAQLAGFDTMVQLSDAPIIVLEGDEYLSSALDDRPKFHHYKPDVALLTGIAWDHINVFPTFENYLDQFRQFIDLIEPNGTLIYYNGDEELSSLCAKARPDVKRVAYQAPTARIENNETICTVDGLEVKLNIFGVHNLENLQGALEIVTALGLDPRDAIQAMASFKGAAKRMEPVSVGTNSAVYKDFAHAPSKLRATVNALKQQYAQRHLTACIELHTYSSLNKDFIGQYKDTMEQADRAIVYYNPHTLEMKRLPELSPEEVAASFGSPGVEVFTDSAALLESLKSNSWEDRNLLMMSSGNFDGLDYDEIGTFVVSNDYEINT